MRKRRRKCEAMSHDGNFGLLLLAVVILVAVGIVIGRGRRRPPRSLIEMAAPDACPVCGCGLFYASAKAIGEGRDVDCAECGQSYRLNDRTGELRPLSLVEREGGVAHD
jgi:hypothetical protein